MKHFGKIILAVGAIIGLFYIGIAYYYSTHFLPRTTFESLPISNMNAAKAETIVAQQFDNQNLTITVDNNTVKELPKKDFLSTENLQQVLQEQIKKQNNLAWPLAYLKPQKIALDNAFDSNELKNSKTSIENWITQYNNNKTDAVNSTIKYENGTFTITDAKPGTKLNVNDATNKILKALAKGENNVDLTNTQVQPIITRDNSNLKQKQAEIEKLAQIKVTYDFNNNKVQIPNEQIKQWIILDNQGNISLDKDQVKSYVQSLADKYNTHDHDIEFNTTSKGKINVPCETYSWSINVDKETNALIQEILKGENFERTPIVNGSASPKGAFIGKTYIEVDKSTQHMWVYQDGKEIISTDVVTGKPESPTPTGVFYVWNKERNAILRGEDYASPVDYWMPIDWEGVGIHDSNWQTAYGGTRYKDGFGSHGCINTPPEIMKQIFEKIPVGTPVIVYD